jgi:hypothetical protein
VPEYGTVTVTVDGIAQLPDETAPDGTIIQQRDYYINYTMKYLLFHRPIPIASVIKATYVPEQDSSVSGDRSVFGFDSSFKLSENVSLEGQFAKSSADFSGNGSGGSALNLKANGKVGKFTMAAGLKNINPSFASVDSIGFMRNEKGGNFSLDYRPNDRMSFHTGYDKFSRPYYFNNYSTSADAPYVDFTNFSTGMTVQMPKWPSLSFNRTRLTNAGGFDTSRISKSLTTDALDLKWAGPSGKMNVGLGFSRNYTDRLRFGIKGKVLLGVASAYIHSNSLGISIGNDYSHNMDADIDVNISAPVTIIRDRNDDISDIRFDDEELLRSKENTEICFPYNGIMGPCPFSPYHMCMYSHHCSMISQSY